MSVLELTAADLQSVLNFTVDLARIAGALILEGAEAMARESDVGEKKNSVDLVTEYDVRVEELVKAALAKAYPAFNFIGEESYSAGSQPPLTDEPTFCVDPIGEPSHTLLRETAEIQGPRKPQMARPISCTVSPLSASPSA